MKYLTEKEQLQQIIDEVASVVSSQRSIVSQAKEKYEFASGAVIWPSTNLLNRKAFYDHSAVVLNTLNVYWEQLIDMRNKMEDKV